MPRKNGTLLTILFLFVALGTAAPSARAEHIFFRTAVNSVPLKGSGVTTTTSLLQGFNSRSSADESMGNTIISPTGLFTFNLDCFNVARFGDGGVIDFIFSPDRSSLLPPPLDQRGLVYDGLGTEKDPEPFSFSRRLPPGIFTGDLILNYTSTKDSEKESVTYPITLISQPTAVPEPTTMLLLGTGLSGIALRLKRRRKNLR